MMSSIRQKQDEIIERFSMLDGDMEMTLNYLMELGGKLPTMDETLKNDDHIVKGCQSKVWLDAHLEGDQVVYLADSNTAITKGLISLLVQVLSREKAEAIVKADLDFPQKIGMSRFIGTQRSNGFAAMVKQMKYYAVALNAQISNV